jgi:hypothetical protein
MLLLREESVVLFVSPFDIITDNHLAAADLGSHDTIIQLLLNSLQGTQAIHPPRLESYSKI